MNYLNTFYITFGFSHALGNHYVVVKAEDEFEARQAMSVSFPNRWAGVYSYEPETGTAIVLKKVAKALIEEGKHCGWT